MSFGPYNFQAHVGIKGDTGGFPGNIATSTIQGIIAPVQFEEWVSFITSKTKGRPVVKTRVVEFIETDDSPPGAGADMDIIAILVFKNVDTGSTFKISIPAPIDSMLESTPAGIRVKATEMQAFADQINLDTTLNVSPRYGYLVQKNK